MVSFKINCHQVSSSLFVDDVSNSLMVSLSFLGEEAKMEEPVSLQSTSEEEEEETKNSDRKFILDYERNFERSEGTELCQNILEEPLVVTFFNANTNAAVGTATVNLLPFLQSNTVEIVDANVAIRAVDNEKNPIKEGSTASISISVTESLYRENSCIFQVTMNNATSLPKTLKSAVENAGNNLSFIAALSLPIDASQNGIVTCLGGSYVASTEQEENSDISSDNSSITWGSMTQRLYISSKTNLKSVLKKQKYVDIELGRRLSPECDLSDPANLLYHGVTSIDLSSLLEPGKSEITTSVIISRAFNESTLAKTAKESESEAASNNNETSTTESDKPDATTEEESTPATSANEADRVSCLPVEIESDCSNKKAIEEIQYAAENEGNSSHSCLWAHSKTTLSISLGLLSNSLLPPFSVPSTPALGFYDIITPSKSNEEKNTDIGDEASTNFSAEVKKIALILAQKYKDSSSDGIAPTASDMTKLIFDLNHSGEYANIKNSLRKCVAHVVKTKYGVMAGLCKVEMEEIYDDVYVHLMKVVHSVLDDNDTEVDVASSSKPSDLKTLQKLAAEYEQAGNIEAARNVHEECVAGSTATAQTWCDYGLFSCRNANISSAQSSLKQSLSLDSTNHQSISALVAIDLTLFLTNNNTQALLEAEALLHHVLSSDEETSCSFIWTLLGLVYACMNGKSVEACNCFYKMSVINDTCDQGLEGCISSKGCGFTKVLKLVVDLHLPQNVSFILSIMEQEDPAVCNGEDVILLLGEAAALLGDKEGVDQAIKASNSHPSSLLCLANYYFLQGNGEATVTQLEFILEQHKECMTLDAYIKLGSLLLSQGRVEESNEVFVQACAVFPCSSTWMSAGISFLKLGDESNAKLSLSEYMRVGLKITP